MRGLRTILTRLVLSGGALFCVPSALTAQNMIAPPIVDIEFGVICNYQPRGEDVAAPDTNAGRIRRGGDPIVFDIVTDQVPAVLGTAFGIRILGEEEMGRRTVTMVTRHPSFGPGYIDTETWPSEMTGGVYSARYFYFEFDYELVPGPWSMEVWLDDRMIVRQDFTVHDGPAARRILDLCPTEGLTS
jgi:hypothetical protein